MRYSASPSLLASLHGRPLLVTDQAPPAGARALAVCWLDDAGRLRAEGDEGAAVPLEGMPLGCIALVAFSAEGARRLEPLAAQWRETAPDSAPPLVDLSGLEAQPAAVLAAIDALAERTRAALAEAAELTRQIVALRDEGERLRSSRRELAAAARPAGCVFEAAPGSGRTPPGAALRQRLPVAARGFAAIDVYLESGSGSLEVELWRLEEDELLARFAVPCPAAGGWRRFVLGEAADVALGTLELRVRPPQGVRLALAEPRPGIAELAQADGAGALAAPLALRVFTATPGLPVSLESDGVLAARVAAMESSTSWRVTAPLRWLRRRLGSR
jgi:hypothetical protein